MSAHRTPPLALLALFGPLLLVALPAFAELVPVRHLEGRIRGFLVLRDLNDKVLATGGLSQRANGSRVTVQLHFHFNDGSTHDETAEFSQRSTFRLLSYHLVQKGPTFERQMDLSANVSSGRVIVKYAEKGEEAKTISERMKLPKDLANGIVTTLLADVDPRKPKTTLSILAATPKPRLVELEISPDGEESFSIAGSPQPALRFEIEVKLGGIAGVVAPLIGKQPPPTQVWMVGGKVPGFLKSEGPLFQDGPVWRIELASPVWPQDRAEPKR